MANVPTTDAGTRTTADDEHPFRYTARLANEIETRWQRYWHEHNTFATPNPGDPGFDPAKPKFYCLDMFPYPSGVGLHVGHPLGYIATDVMCRYRRMRGFNVLHPMGFDAFGLPAEQFAVEHGVHPRVTTRANIDNMIRQLKALGLSYDWSRCLATIDPGYYKWTQWIFLQLYQSYYDRNRNAARPISELIGRLETGEILVRRDGSLADRSEREADARTFGDLGPSEQDAVLAGQRLAYLAEVPVNWCPDLGTVLANEEVTNDGRSERGNHPVFKRPLKQWMLRITAYAERLAGDLDLVDWPQPIKRMQLNWIGGSTGAMIDFPVVGTRHRIRVFTTCPHTIFGATYMVLAPEHPLVGELTTTGEREAVRRYQRQAESISDFDRMAEQITKTGVFIGAHCVNPATGEKIPIWIADYVLMGYGTGAIMAVPAHDLRDWAFARQFQLPIRQVVRPPAGHEPTRKEAALAYAEGGRTHYPFAGAGTAIDSANDQVSLNGLPTDKAKRAITDWLRKKGLGRAEVQYKLRDWLFSRQRYWGEPFPILHDPDGRTIGLGVSELPVELPEITDFSPQSTDPGDMSPPRPPLARAPESWRYVERDGRRFRRELNTMPQWAGSCWYYLRFIDPGNQQRLVNEQAERYWMGDKGVDLYVGGAEHAVLHLLYARFWHKVLYDLGHVSTAEPFARLFNQGYIQAFAYRDERGFAVPAREVVDSDGAPASEVQDQPGTRFFHKGRPVIQEYGKMGKSLKNATSPDEICAAYGCDTLRLYEMYMGPLEAHKPWNPRDIIGPLRFLQRVWRLGVNEQTGELAVASEPDGTIEQQLNRTIAKVGQDIERMAFNTAIAAMIELVNAATSSGGLTLDQLSRLVLILSPFAPHLSEELRSRLGNEGTLAAGPWPVHDEAMLASESVEIPVQIGGKVRGRLTVPADADRSQIETAALADERIAALLEGKTVRKVVVVPGKIVNFVVS